MAGPSLGTAYVQIVASAKGIGGSITKAVSGEAGSAGSSAGSLLAGKIKGAIVAAGIGTALIGGIKSAISETGALQQSYVGGLDTLYGSAAEKAREYARAAAEAGISQNSFAEQAVSFGAALKQAYGGNTTKAMEAANTAILDMADNAAKMGTPLQSIQDAYQGFAKQNYTMLDNLKLGYGGTKTEMERLLADAQKISGVEYNIDNLGDVYDAIHVIQGELGLTGVAADEAKSTLTGSFEGMRAAWQNLLGNIGLGQNVAESMRGFSDAVSNYLFNNLIPTIGTILQSLPTAISTFINTGAPQLMQAGLTLIKNITAGAKQNLPTLISDLVSGITSLSGNLLSAASSFITVGLNLVQTLAKGIISSLPTLIAAVPKIITQLVLFLNQNAPKFLIAGLNIIKSIAIGLIKAIPALVKAIPQIVAALFSAWKAIKWVELGKTAVKNIVKGIKALKGLVKSGMESIKNFMLSPIKSAQTRLASIVDGIKSKATSAFQSVRSKAVTVWNAIKEAITHPIQTARDTVKRVLDKIKGFFPLSVGKIFSNLKVPHINISGGKAPFGIGGFGTKPSISVSWNAKAMNNPYLFSGATLFGAGETGDEVLYGRNALLRDIADATNTGHNYVTINNYIDGAESPEVWGIRLARQLELEMRG